MVSLRAAGRLAGLLFCLGCALALPPREARAQDEETVTSDTPQFCMHLLDQVSALVRIAPGPLPQEVTSLSTEGQRMCNHGQTRSGIMRLRRALVLMREYDTAP